jgi:hypothetical protein
VQVDELPLDAGDWDEADALLEQVLARGTSAARQRAVLARTGEIADVARSVVDLLLPTGG